MTTVDRNWLLLAVCLVALTFVAVSFAGAQPVTENVLIFPMIVLIELIIYFIAAMVSNPRATIGMAAGQALLLMFLRAVCSLGGGVFFSIFTQNVESTNFLYTWVNPVVVTAQVVLLVLSAPFLFALTMPDLVGIKEAARLRGEAPQAKKRETAGKAGLESSPSGGFVQVFSFQELSSLVKKSHGLEGFLVISNEGLVVWKDFPLRVDFDELAAKFAGHSHKLAQIVEEAGLTKVRRVMVESREHFLFATTLNQNFSLILIFNGRVAVEEVSSRVPMLAKSSREFLQWKYPSLPLKAGNPNDASLEMA